MRKCGECGRGTENDSFPLFLIPPFYMTLRKKDRQVAIIVVRQARDVRRMQHLHTGV
jgi:hypothetical protein